MKIQPGTKIKFPRGVLEVNKVYVVCNKVTGLWVTKVSFCPQETGESGVTHDAAHEYTESLGNLEVLLANNTISIVSGGE